MTQRNALSKVIAGIAVAGALTLTSVLGGAAAADSGAGDTTLEDIAVVKEMDSATFDGDGDVDGHDFLVWQRQLGASSSADGVNYQTISGRVTAVVVDPSD